MQQQEIQLSPQALQINRELINLIRLRIEEDAGVISFAEFMRLALYSPGLGYYHNGLQKFGEQGDFITAPEMGDLFAHGLVSSLASLDKRLTSNLLEIGAGTGQLAADILSILQKSGQVPNRYFILEPSSMLQALQFEKIQQCCPEAVNKVVWLEQLPDNFDGIIFANEVLDAIPCERIVKSNNSWQKLGVTINNKQFEWQEIGELDNKELPQLLNCTDYVEGYTTEVRPLVNSWIKALANCLTEGSIFLFDYGYPQAEYYHPQRVEGSLRCFTRHQAHSQALELIGLQDITAHVDFTEVAKAAVANDLDVDGFTTQAGFLLENGILEKAQSHSFDISTEEESSQNYQISQQIQKLTAPGQMGEVIKVIALSKNSEKIASGFNLQDQMHRL